ncbi:MAG: HEAT repeat domain-containing protein [Sedimentisphaerales bacterium]
MSLGIGASFFDRYPGSCYGYYPYSPWYDGYYTWLGRDRIWWDSGWYSRFPRHHHWPGRYRSSGLGIWIGGTYPIVVDPPVVVYDPPAPAGKPPVDTQLSEAIRKKQSELLKVLKIGDKEKRLQAIDQLAAFSSDAKVRAALEEVLLSDPDPDLRKEVAVAFGKTESQLVVAALTQAKDNDPVRDVRQAAYRSLIMIKGY